MSWTHESPLTLTAHEDRSGTHQLSESEVRFLKKELPDQIGRRSPVELHRVIGGTRIETAGAAGVVILPSGRTIRIQPTVGTDNFLYLWTYALGLDERQITPTPVPATPGNEVIEVFARLFESELSSLLRSGLRPRYEKQHVVTPQPSGQIDIQRQLRRSPPRVDMACTERTLTYDTVLNRGITRAVEILVQALRATPQERDTHSDSIQDDLERHLVSLRDYVKSTDVTAADLAEVTVTRLENEYTHLVPMAENILESSFLGNVMAGAATRTCALLIQMWRLHEQLVERSFRAAVADTGLRLETQNEVKGFLAGDRFVMYPDIVAYDENNPVAVIDAKYKTGLRKPGNRQLYQLAAYQKALDVPGLLVYPEQSFQHCEYRVDEEHTLRAATLPTDTDAESYATFTEMIEQAAAEELSNLLEGFQLNSDGALTSSHH